MTGNLPFIQPIGRIFASFTGIECIMNRFLSCGIWAFIIINSAFGQTAYPFRVSMDRMLWHDKIDKQQKKLYNVDGLLKLSADESVNLQIEDALIRKIDNLQEAVETDSIANGQVKVKYLRSIEKLLEGYNINRNRRDFHVSMAPVLFESFLECMELDKKNESIEPVIAKNEYGVGKILVECFLSPNINPGITSSRVLLLRKYCELHPDEILPVLSKNPSVPFANEFIKIAAYNDINKIYDYAAGRNVLAARIRSHPDSLVRIVAQMANSKSGQLYFPFLDNILKGKISFQEIDRVKDSELEYYRLMVKTRVEYAGRMLPPTRDTVAGMRTLTTMMARKAKEYFIREINSLHAVEDERVRFRRLEGLSPQELYYLIVLGEDEIYTSSYLNVYKRIFQRMNVPRGDSLLLSVNGDYFRKFIKMAAGYNTLNDFLGKMDRDNATTTMKAFVIKLEDTKELEESVDVADSYSSIIDKNKELAKYILEQVKWNYDRNVQNNNKRGVVIYNLLKILFESADTSKKMNLSEKLGIPPVYSVDRALLTDDTGRVVQQVFFYGDEDKDGQNSFINFMAMFRGRAEWKIADNPNWVSISSTKGKPVMIFANKPLLGDDDPDQKAQEKLGEYLEAKNLKPTIVIHRGHSYHLQYTLRQLAPSARIVVLGSCGGYNNLNEVLSVCEDAHIISSKQVGSKTVNEPILQAINNSLVAGKNIDWIPLWRDLSGRFRDEASKEKFDDYIPPYKNLGAIFIKAYRKAMGN
jgi:hypothetical protein